MSKKNKTTDADGEILFRKIAGDIRALVNPANLFSGAKLDESLVADNVVIFKRTSAEMLRPQGVTHSYHHRFVLVIPLACAGRIHVDGRDHLLDRGSAYLVFPHQFHHYLDIEAGGLNWLFITFECKQAERLAPLRNSPRKLEGAALEMLAELVRNHLAPERDADRNFEIVVTLSRLLRQLLTARETTVAEDAATTLEEAHGEILRAINAHVRANLDKPLTIADIAGRTGYSVSHLRAIFRKNLGVSLGAYMRDSRISTAASMLSAPEPAGIEAISKACGFSSIHAFSRAFKTAMGVPPTAYLKLLKTGGMNTARE